MTWLRLTTMQAFRADLSWMNRFVVKPSIFLYFYWSKLISKNNQFSYIILYLYSISIKKRWSSLQVTALSKNSTLPVSIISSSEQMASKMSLEAWPTNRTNHPTIFIQEITLPSAKEHQLNNTLWPKTVNLASIKT